MLSKIKEVLKPGTLVRLNHKICEICNFSYEGFGIGIVGRLASEEDFLKAVFKPQAFETTWYVVLFSENLCVLDISWLEVVNP